MSTGKMNFMLVGVGGQGTLLASDILADLGVRLGFDTKKAEIHGMAQRGGSVTSFVRWDKHVFSPIIAKGEVDILIAFESLEAIRYLEQLKTGGTLLVNNQNIEPITVKAGDGVYPSSAELSKAFERGAGKVCHVDGLQLAEKAGNSKAANVVILGALSALLDTPPDAWLEAVEAHVPPKAIEGNRKAFMLGREQIEVGEKLYR
jgi:indolepyruvate ferredoxin oxidoreductase, beta subunit